MINLKITEASRINPLATMNVYTQFMALHPKAVGVFHWAPKWTNGPT